MKNEKKRRQRERRRLEKFRKTLVDQLPEFFMEWVEGLPTKDQVRELEIARVNLARIRG